MQRVNALSPWYSVEDDGDPVVAGWYEVLYLGQDETEKPDRLYFDGSFWLFSPHNPNLTTFGNTSTAGERWRGASTPHGGYYV
jgi:hypothetical protein